MARKTKEKDIVDTEVYEVERIIASKIIRGKLHYHVKWEGYADNENTDEPEFRLNCDTKLIDYIVKQIDPTFYTKDVMAILRNLESYENESDVLKIIDPLSSLAATTLLAGSVKFVSSDVISSKFMLLEYIRDYEQTHLLQSAMLPTEDVIDASMVRYSNDLQYRKEVFPDYPFVRIILPILFDTVFYSPPPQSSLLFEPVSSQMATSRVKHLFVPESDDLGFNNVKAFVRNEYFESVGITRDPRVFPFLNSDKHQRIIEGMDRYDTESRFLVTLELVQEPTRGWILRGGHDIDVDTPLVLMTGVLRPIIEAHESLVSAGEQVAFTSFIEIPQNKMCLDRREFYDFSKFIPHSCKPTCGVRLAESGNSVPDLVVYNRVPLNDDNGRQITIDYFGGFTNDVRQYFKLNKPRVGRIFSLYNNNVDFVHCQCYANGCRQVLYIDKSTCAKNATKSKRERLKNLQPGFLFAGMQVVESCKVWSITDGMFEE